MIASALFPSAAGAERTEPIWPKLAPAIFLILWSGGFVVAKIGLRHAEPYTLLTIRYLAVLAILVPVMLAMRPPLPKSGREWFHLCMVGLMIQAGYFCFCYAAFRAGVSAGTAGLIVSMQPVLVAVLAPALVGEGRISALRWYGFALGVAGSAIVIQAKSGVDPAPVLGLLFAVGALLSMTGGTLWERRFGVSHHPVSANTVQYAVGLVFTAPLALMFETMEVDWNSEMMAALAYLVLANSLLAVTLLLAMLRRGEASRVSALFFLVPPMSALMALLILGEPMPFMGWVGMMVAATGVALALKKEAPDRSGRLS